MLKIKHLFSTKTSQVCLLLYVLSICFATIIHTFKTDHLYYLLIHGIVPTTSDTLVQLNIFNIIFVVLPTLLVIFLLFNLLKNDTISNIVIAFTLYSFILLLEIGATFTILSIIYFTFIQEIIFYLFQLGTFIIGISFFSILLYRFAGNKQEKLTS